jgi:hypothetical protein
MEFLEKDLEQIIFEASQEELVNKGLCLTGKKFRQLKIGGYGIADLVYIERPHFNPYSREMMKGIISVVELKQNKITISAFLQAVRYVRGIQRFLEINRLNLYDCFNFEIVLIGSKIDLDSSVVFLPDVFQNDSEGFMYESSKTRISMYKYEMNLNGLEFNDVCGYVQRNEKL